MINTTNYFYIWSLFIPITSILIIPSVQGTTPGYILAFIAVIFMVFIKPSRNYFARDFVTFLFVFLFINLVSQLPMLFGVNLYFNGVELIDPSDKSEYFRTSMLTQSLYLIAGVILFTFVKSFYKDSWIKPMKISAILFAAYGLYEWFFFLITGINGDFLTNRKFDNGFTGSFFQTIEILGLRVQRLKSLAGEPSMYAFSITPFMFFFWFLKQKKIAMFLMITLMLSTSTTALIAVLVFLAHFIKKIKKYVIPAYFIAFFVIIILWVTGLDEIYNISKVLFLDKITLNDYSGNARFGSFQTHLEYFLELSPLNILFGIGFGTVRSTDFFTTILINNGIVGFSLFSLLFFYPIVKLKSENGLKLSLVFIYLSMMISVPEFSYLTVWLFLGIAYNKMSRQNKNLEIKTEDVKEPIAS